MNDIIIFIVAFFASMGVFYLIGYEKGISQGMVGAIDAMNFLKDFHDEYKEEVE